MTDQPQVNDAEAVVDKILEDISDSVYMGSMMLALSKPQRDRMRRRWIKIIEGAQVERDWANY
jgi:hypothetical protein